MPHAGEPLAPGDAPDTQALQNALMTVLEGERPRRLCVLLGADLCRHWVLDVPATIGSWRELQALAMARAEALFTPAGVQDGACEWTLAADWRQEWHQLCCVAPARWLAALRTIAQDCGVHMQVRSALQVAWARLSATGVANGSVAWATPGHLVVAVVHDGQARRWRTVRCPANAPWRALHELAVNEARMLAPGGASNKGPRWVGHAQRMTPSCPADSTLVFVDAPWPSAAQPTEAAWAAALSPAVARRERPKTVAASFTP